MSQKSLEVSQKPIKIYFKGGDNIKNPVDVDGKEIKVGSILTSDSHGDAFDKGFYERFYPTWSKEYIQERINRPLYEVKINDKGCLYGEGLDIVNKHTGSRMYLHDFRFKYTKIVE